MSTSGVIKYDDQMKLGQNDIENKPVVKSGHFMVSSLDEPTAHVRWNKKDSVMEEQKPDTIMHLESAPRRSILENRPKVVSFHFYVLRNVSRHGI